MLSGILCHVFIIIMAIRKCIYGNKTNHDETYWKDFTTAKANMPINIVNEPYLLPIRYKNPVPGFVIGILVFVSIPSFAYSVYIDFSDFGLKQIVVLIPIIYAMIIVTVSIIRLFRRIRAFDVKINKN